MHSLLRTQEITSLCERGIGEHEGEYRLSFFYGNRRARLSKCDTALDDRLWASCPTAPIASHRRIARRVLQKSGMTSPVRREA
nr:DUF6522 family protein [Mesorhizobium qingshengii]